MSCVSNNEGNVPNNKYGDLVEFSLKEVNISSSEVLQLKDSPKKTEYNILMQNVEVLAGGENLTPIHCVGSGCVDCPINAVNVEALANDEGGGMLDCPNGCLDKTGHCFCYGYHPYEEKIWK
ncbi:MAG: hypothetical protein SOX26_12190 [Phocaeicola sp.]|nr:hypothetical protein [Phocaeicola sp.]